MPQYNGKCVVLADRHQSLSEGVRGLLATVFETVVMVADDASLLESVRRLQPEAAVADLSLRQDAGLAWLRELRACRPTLKVIVLSVHDEPHARQAAMTAGADGFVLKRHISRELLPTIDALMAPARHAGESLANHGSSGDGSAFAGDSEAQKNRCRR